MKINYENIVLRDYEISDISDEVRWSTEETDWIRLDTPWEDVKPEDPESIREDMMGYYQMSSRMPETVSRPRLEIEAEGKHIGFVSSYFLDENYDETVWNPNYTKDKKHTIGIAVCEPSARGKGYGTAALKAFIDYHRKKGIHEVCLETIPENRHMIHIAEKLGFKLVKRDVEFKEKDGRYWDNLVYSLSI